MLHWQHLPVPLRTFRDVHIPNHANIRVMDFHRLAGVFGPLHILLMHHDFLNKQPQQLRRQLLNVCVAFGLAMKLSAPDTVAFSLATSRSFCGMAVFNCSCSAT